nr:uncharacterized protein LOC109147770 [Ipomoea batatas]
MPSSLVARVYKARYYPRCSFFDAKEGSNPSYIWKGMMAVQDTLKHGCRRSIGSGTDTVIGSDLWLPEDENPYVQTELHESLRGTPVSSLLNDQVSLPMPSTYAIGSIARGRRWGLGGDVRELTSRAVAGGRRCFSGSIMSGVAIEGVGDKKPLLHSSPSGDAVGCGCSCSIATLEDALVMVGVGLAVKRPLSQLGIIEGTEAPCTSSLTAFTN